MRSYVCPYTCPYMCPYMCPSVCPHMCPKLACKYCTTGNAFVREQKIIYYRIKYIANLAQYFVIAPCIANVAHYSSWAEMSSFQFVLRINEFI